MLDILIQKGTLIDGSRSLAYKADLGIKDGIIVKIDRSIDESAEHVIDADGLVVAPGFIDTHSHSDFHALIPSDPSLSLEQGITMQLVGNCGDSLTPYPEEIIESKIPDYISEDDINQIKRICHDPKTFMDHASGVSYGANTAFLIGHNSIRLAVMGSGDAKPSQAQMADMKKLVADAMQSGMLGYSSGLAYAPSIYADTDELIELAKVAAGYGGIYASHIRGEGAHVFDAIDEAISIGKESGATVLISHIKIMGRRNRGKADEILEKLHQAREEGVAIVADQYPFDTASAPLISQIPPRYLALGREALLKRITEPGYRREIEKAIFSEADEFESCLFDAGYDGTLIAISEETPEYIGKSIQEIAEAESKDAIDVMMELLIANRGEVQCLYKVASMEDVETFMQDSIVFTGVDWSILGSRPEEDSKCGAHPRGTATFARKIELARDKKLLSPEEVIFRMTGGPANAIGLKGRGFLREGYSADVCILDYEGVIAQADYIYPFRRNQGIKYVIVNGRIAVEEGQYNGEKNGIAILRAK